MTHEVKKGETLFSIARRYGLEVGALMNLNGLSTARLRIDQRLMIFLQEFAVHSVSQERFAIGT